MKRLSGIKAAIFDMDGVVFDSERTWAMFDRKADELFNTGFAPSVRARFCGMDEASVRRTIKELKPDLDVDAYREYIRAGVRDYEKEHGEELKRGAVELIKKLKASGVKAALATSSRRARALALFDRVGLSIDTLFDAAMFGDDVVEAKPNPEIFLKAAAKLGVSPNEAAVFEDSPNGIAAAIGGGFIPVMVIDLIPPLKEYKDKGVIILNSLEELL